MDSFPAGYMDGYGMIYFPPRTLTGREEKIPAFEIMLGLI